MVALILVCAELEGGIQRAESDHCGEQEYCAEDNKHDTECAGDDAAKVQLGEHCGEDDTSDAIDVGHIAFHGKSPLVD